ncbi:uncharacterized protein LOC142351736 [Convolutriloba macropyga]|uniref:uncharacterized protein LOC142351736 n=1 Tax=Convolutriloba macropyga TaxID=536237 RepID=UPI003F520464
MSSSSSSSGDEQVSPSRFSRRQPQRHNNECTPITPVTCGSVKVSQSQSLDSCESSQNERPSFLPGTNRRLFKARAVSEPSSHEVEMMCSHFASPNVVTCCRSMSAIAETSMTTGGMDGQTTYAGVEVPPIKLDSNYVSDGSNLDLLVSVRNRLRNSGNMSSYREDSWRGDNRNFFAENSCNSTVIHLSGRSVTGGGGALGGGAGAGFGATIGASTRRPSVAIQPSSNRIREVPSEIDSQPTADYDESSVFVTNKLPVCQAKNEDQLATTLCATVKPQNKANATLRTSSPSPSLSTPDNNYNNNQNNLNKNVNDNNNNNTDNKYNKSYGRIEQKEKAKQGQKARIELCSGDAEFRVAVPRGCELTKGTTNANPNWTSKKTTSHQDPLGWSMFQPAVGDMVVYMQKQTTDQSADYSGAKTPAFGKRRDTASSINTAPTRGRGRNSLADTRRSSTDIPLVPQVVNQRSQHRPLYENDIDSLTNNTATDNPTSKHESSDKPEIKNTTGTGAAPAVTLDENEEEKLKEGKDSSYESYYTYTAKSTSNSRKLFP